VFHLLRRVIPHIICLLYTNSLDDISLAEGTSIVLSNSSNESVLNADDPLPNPTLNDSLAD